MAGNPNPTGRKKDKPIRDALLAALRQDPERLKRCAEKAWEKAETGDLATFKEIADRLDGKSVQPIVGGDEDDAPISHSLKVEFVKSGDDKAT
jgi:hypothetical protein